MTWHIVADSSCDLHTLPEAGQEVDFSTVPFHIRVGEREYIDEPGMDIDAMLRDNETCGEAAYTGCPSPQGWLEKFSRPGPVLAFTISGSLSGSYNSAVAARRMLLEEEPDKQIEIIDTRATGPETVLLIRKARELIARGLPIHEIADAVRAVAQRTHIIFALSSYHNLIKAGRVNKLVALVAGHLGFWGIGKGDDEGKIVMCGKARGQKRMVRFLLDEIRETGLAGKNVVISHCFNEETARTLKEDLQRLFADIRVDILPSRGLDSFYAERHGLIIGF